MAEKILKDSHQRLCNCYVFLRSGRRLNVRRQRTNRFRNTFVPSSINLYNRKLAELIFYDIQCDYVGYDILYDIVIMLCMLSSCHSYVMLSVEMLCVCLCFQVFRTKMSFI